MVWTTVAASRSLGRLNRRNAPIRRCMPSTSKERKGRATTEGRVDFRVVADAAVDFPVAAEDSPVEGEVDGDLHSSRTDRTGRRPWNGLQKRLVDGCLR